MYLVDAQVHTWTGGTPPPVHQPEPLTNEALLAQMDAAGVARAVLVPPNWDPGAIPHAMAGAAAHPDRFAVMHDLPLDAPDGPQRLAGWRRDGRLGLRLTFATPERRAAIESGAADWIWRGAEAAGVPIMIAVWGELALLLPVARRFPGLKLIVDHLGIAVTHRTMDAASFADMPAVLELAKFPNVAIKASGLPAHSTEAYPWRNLHQPLRQAFDAYGPDRMFWGTDLTRMPCGYGPCITMFTEELPWLSAADKARVMGRALCDFIDWPIPPGS